MYNELGDKGLQILAFPCNGFQGQEPGTPEDIASLNKAQGANFPFFEKIEVNGTDCHEVYQYLRGNAPELRGEVGSFGVIPWNFSKFIVNKDGHVVSFHPSTVSPNDLKEDLKKMLD